MVGIEREMAGLQLLRVYFKITMDSLRGAGSAR